MLFRSGGPVRSHAPALPPQPRTYGPSAPHGAGHSREWSVLDEADVDSRRASVTGYELFAFDAAGDVTRQTALNNYLASGNLDRDPNTWQLATVPLRSFQPEDGTLPAIYAVGIQEMSGVTGTTDFLYLDEVRFETQAARRSPSASRAAAPTPGTARAPRARTRPSAACAPHPAATRRGHSDGGHHPATAGPAFVDEKRAPFDFGTITTPTGPINRLQRGSGGTDWGDP